MRRWLLAGFVVTVLAGLPNISSQFKRNEVANLFRQKYEAVIPLHSHTPSIPIESAKALVSPAEPDPPARGGHFDFPAISELDFDFSSSLPSSVTLDTLPATRATFARRPDNLEYAPSSVNGGVTQAEINQLKDGLDRTLTAIENNIVREVFAETFPLVGQNFQVAWSNNASGFRYASILRDAIVAGLSTLTNQPDYAPTSISTAIKSRFTAAGFSSQSQVIVTTDNNEVQLAFTTSDSFAATNVPVALDAGLPNLLLRFAGPTNAQTTVTANFSFNTGVDGAGFYFDTTTTNLQFATVTTITNLVTPVRFARLPYMLSDVTTNRTRIPLTLHINLRDPNNDDKLRLNEISGGADILNGGVSGNTRLFFNLLSSLPSSAMLPQIGTHLSLLWNFNTSINPEDDNSTFGGRPVLTFEYNRINLDSFFNSFAERAFRQIDQVTDPLQPLLDVFTAEIPVLSDLGSDAVTILHLFGVDDGTIAAIDGLATVISMASLANSYSGNQEVYVDLGSFAMFGDLRSEPLNEVMGSVARLPSTNRDADLRDFLDEAATVNGLSFPILDDGRVLANLLLGRNATLFSWRSGVIEFSEEFRQYFPVLGPIGITMGGHVGTRMEFGFGYDTQGLFDFDAGGGNDSELFFNGFFAMATDESGAPVTGISLDAGITAGIEANFVIASAGVEGDITASIGIYLDENLGDEFGRIRGNTLLDTALTDLFYASGSLTAGLRAYLEIGFSPFSVSYDFESPRVTLISFDSQDEVVPILASPTLGGVLTLNVGERAPLRIHGDAEDRSEEYYISLTNDVDGPISIQAFGEIIVYPEPSRIVGHAGERDDVLDAGPDISVPVEFSGGPSFDYLAGGSANDILDGGGDPDKLRGRGGNDILRGGLENDQLIGGPGNDELDGGDGLDLASWVEDLIPLTLDLRTGTFTGAAAGDTLISIERFGGTKFADVMDGSEGDDSLLRGEGGDDIIRGHDGQDLLEGSGGADTIAGGDHDDFINGGSGADALDGGPGRDILSYLGALNPVTVSLLTGLGTRGDADGDILSNFEILMGAGLPKEDATIFNSGDDLEGSDNSDSIFGMEGADLIKGAGGDDLLYGNHPDAEGSLQPGFDQDTILGGSGADTIFGQEDDDELDGEEGPDTLDGGAGHDHLLAFDVQDIDFLDGGLGTNRLSADFSDKTNDFSFIVGTNNAWQFPDGDEFLNIQTLGELRTGSGNDYIQLSTEVEHAFWNKKIDAGPGTDLVLTDWRGYYVAGTNFFRTRDTFDGGLGNDTISFEQSIERVTANLASGGVGGAGTGIIITNFENIIGTYFSDSLTGDAGDNIFMPLSSDPNAFGGDRIQGGNGTDTLRVDYSNDPNVNQYGIFMNPNATTGGEAISLGSGFPGSRTVLFYNVVERFEITGGNSRDVLYGEGVSWSGIPYEGYADRLIGMGGNDYIEARLGDDYVDGGEGNDTIEMGAGNDIAFGGPGNDSILLVRTDNMLNRFGHDFVDAGPGDDAVSNFRSANGDSTSAISSDKMELDGGEGIDLISADFGNMTNDFVFDDANITEVSLANGGYLRNFELLGSVVTGRGNDRILLSGRSNNALVLREGNDIVNPGMGIDRIIGGSGDDMVILDYSVMDDPDLAGVTYNSSGGYYERRKIGTNTLVDQIFINGFERLHVTGSSKDDVFYGSFYPDRFFAGPGNDYIRGSDGHDWLDGGPGADRLEGGQNNDTYVVDNVGDSVTESASQGADSVRSSIDYTLPASVEHLTLYGSALNATGNGSANQITGNSKNNILRGEAGNDTLNGSGGPREFDRLNGGLGADTFVLGEGSRRFYDDNSPSTPGYDGFALIEDFSASHNDRIRTAGPKDGWFTASSPLLEFPGLAIYHDSNGNLVLDESTDELVAILLSTEPLGASNTLNTAIYTEDVDPASAGLTAGIQATLAATPAGSSLTLQFSILDPLPEGMLLEVQSSVDLGLTEPWTTIASKTGSAEWTGTQIITITPEAGGKVSVTISNLPLSSHLSQNFYRIRLSNQ